MAKKASSLTLQNDLRLLEDRFSVSAEQIFNSSIPQWVVGLDEVGRGCLAGPVVAGAAAIELNQDNLNFEPKYRVTDSKKLSEEARECVHKALKEDTRYVYATAEASCEEIDQINILQASLLAMKRAFELVQKQIPSGAQVWLLIDGNKLPLIEKVAMSPVIKGDSLSFVIALSSIAAKQHRDQLMRKLSEEYPEYLWHKNVGYPTEDHTSALLKIGISPWHRKTFRWAGTPLGEFSTKENVC